MNMQPVTGTPVHIRCTACGGGAWSNREGDQKLFADLDGLSFAPTSYYCGGCVVRIGQCMVSQHLASCGCGYKARGNP